MQGLHALLRGRPLHVASGQGSAEEPGGYVRLQGAASSYRCERRWTASERQVRHGAGSAAAADPQPRRPVRSGARSRK